jgi:hypothetical protein
MVARVDLDERKIDLELVKRADREEGKLKKKRRRR